MRGEMEQMTELEAECRHKYRVRSIREDDYGCEERPEGVWPTVLVELEDENGQLRLLRQKDHYLYEQQIEEGDQVILEQEILKKNRIIWERLTRGERIMKNRREKKPAETAG